MFSPAVPAARSNARRLLALALVLALAATAQLATRAFAGDASTAVIGGIDQAYAPGSAAGSATAPSTDVAYDGEALRVQATLVGRQAAEPTLGVDKQGNAFFAAGTFDGPGVVVPRTFVMRSTDGGLKWDNASPMVPVIDQPGPPVTLDPMVHVDTTTGRVFNPELYVGCTYMNISDDQGKTWLTNPVACGDFVNDHQTVTTGPPPANLTTLNYPNVFYYCFNRVADSNCGRSLDGGLTFTPTPTPAFLGYDSAAGGLCGGLHGHIDTDSKGRLFLPKGHCGKPWLAVSEDGGNTWTRTKVSDMATAGTHTAVATDDADNVYYLWWDKEQRLPWLAVSTDNGKTFGAPMMIAPPGVAETNFPVLEAGEAGKIAVNFPGTTVANRSDGKRAWNQYLVVSMNVLDADPVFVSTTANKADDPVHRGNCGPGRCGPLWDFQDIVVSPADGGFWAAAVDACVKTSCTKPGGTADGNSVGEGVAVRQVGGPRIRTVAPAASS